MKLLTSRLAMAVLLCAVLIATSGTASAGIIGLTVDDPNTLVVAGAAFTTAKGNSTSDGFAYNPANPTSPLPSQAHPDGAHSAEPDGDDAHFSFDFTAGPITLAANEIFNVDVYGRGDGCCQDRDDNFDLELYSGGVNGTLVALIAGLGITNEPLSHTRTSIGGEGITFDSLRLVAHDSSGVGDGGNYFYLMEIRANTSVVIPEPATLSLIGLAGLGLLATRRM